MSDEGWRVSDEEVSDEEVSYEEVSNDGWTIRGEQWGVSNEGESEEGWVLQNDPYFWSSYNFKYYKRILTFDLPVRVAAKQHF